MSQLQKIACHMLVIHSLYLSHLREIADGSRHTIAIKQNLRRLLCSACQYTHAPTAYSDVTTNTTAIPCTIGMHTPAVFHKGHHVIFQAHLGAS